MTEVDRANVRAMLVASGFAPRDIGWMTASCPSIQLCKALCNQRVRWWR